MKADTFAKLVVLETLVDAEIGHLLEARPAAMDSFRETLVARISDLVDEIDALDAVAAARVYDAVVDFLAELTDDAEGAIAATLRFKDSMSRVADRGLTRRDQDQADTWAVVLDELLEELADEYHLAVLPSGDVAGREYARVQVLLARAREVADRLLWSAGAPRRADVRAQIDRLTYAVRHQRLKPTEVDLLIRPTQRRVRRYRSSTLTRLGAYVVGQLLGRSGRRAEDGDGQGGGGRRRGGKRSGVR